MSTASANPVYRILGADGEGYFNTEDGTHAYDVFTVGDKTISGNGRQIDIFHIAKMIRAEMEHSTEMGQVPIFIGYFYTYDATQQIKSLSDYELERLYDTPSRTAVIPKGADHPKYKKAHTRVLPVKIDIGDRFSPDRFKIDVQEGRNMTFYFPKAETLTKARFNQDEKYIKWNKAVVQDVGTIFSTSFIKAMEAFKVPMTAAEESMLTGGKANRAINATYAERADMITSIIEYNRLEIRLIYRLIVKMMEALKAVGVNVRPERDLSGIGALAGRYLAQQAEVNEIIKSYVLADTISPEVYQYANDSYYGGWAETFRPGLHDHMTQVDITSAYPHIMRNLPSLEGAIPSTINSMEHAHNAFSAGSIVYVDIEFQAKQQYIGALPFRTEGDSVLRPQWGRGKYLYAEVLASHNAGLMDINDTIFYSGHAITPVSSAKPFKYVEHMFNERLRAGKKTVVGSMLKVLTNSQYGKVAQSVGNPAFANPIYATMITAGARIQLLNAIGTHPDGLTATLATATDAVFFSTPHTGLDLTPNTLGAWEESHYSKSFLLKPGIWGGIEADGQWGGIISDGNGDLEAEWGVKTRGISQEAFMTKLYDHVIPTLESFRDAKQWDIERMFNTENTWSMMTLGEAFNRGRLDEVGEFMVGEHGTPEMIREVHFNIRPKRSNIRWVEGLGFMTDAPMVMGAGFMSAPVAMPNPRLIGNVDFDDDGY